MNGDTLHNMQAVLYSHYITRNTWHSKWLSREHSRIVITCNNYSPLVDIVSVFQLACIEFLFMWPLLQVSDPPFYLHFKFLEIVDINWSNDYTSDQATTLISFEVACEIFSLKIQEAPAIAGFSLPKTVEFFLCYFKHSSQDRYMSKVRNQNHWVTLSVTRIVDALSYGFPQTELFPNQYK